MSNKNKDTLYNSNKYVQSSQRLRIFSVQEIGPKSIIISQKLKTQSTILWEGFVSQIFSLHIDYNIKAVHAILLIYIYFQLRWAAQEVTLSLCVFVRSSETLFFLWTYGALKPYTTF